MNPNPYPIPANPKVTIRGILKWAVRQGDVDLWTVAAKFGITHNDASVRLRKLHRWGYLRRYKATAMPQVYHYTPTRFGRSAARRWAK